LGCELGKAGLNHSRKLRFEEDLQMAWSFLEYIPTVRRFKASAEFINSEIQKHERKKDMQEHWPKCLTAADGNVEKAKDMFVDIVFNKPAWLSVVLLVDPPEKAEMLRRHIDYLVSRASVPPTLPAASTSGMTANLNIESSVSGADVEIDGAFVGNTPSTVAVGRGSHQIVVKKKGFTDWSRTLNVTGGTVNLSAELEQEQAKQ
jgi:PEGA domain